MNSKLFETMKVIVLCLVVFVGAGGLFYVCEILPMEECMNEGHSLMYCQKLLNRN